ncbi:MAG: MFS transporter [Bdellovibrionales bacterium]|nr:MFS transporter [Bdellovibrionales bacterium]
MVDNHAVKNWKESLQQFLKPSVIIMLFFGFSAGLPILLIFSSLSLWLREAGVERSAVTFFSWAALGYSFKFVWAPLVDRLPLPFLHKKLGRRRSWILVAQVFVVLGILGMALTNPTSSSMSLTVMAFATIVLGFSSATQDISIDAYRIESDTQEMQALLSSTYIAGYRIGMIVAGAGALFLASHFGSTGEHYSYSAWRTTYFIMAMAMLVGILTTFLAPEPQVQSRAANTNFTTLDYLRFTGLFAVIASIFAGTFFVSSSLTENLKSQVAAVIGEGLSGFLIESTHFIFAVGMAVTAAILLLKVHFVNKQMVQETYVDPIKDFFDRYGQSVAILLLSLVGLYRISDIVLGVISNVFYQDMGFTKEQIAGIVKTFGLIMTLLGGFLGGILTVRFGVIRMLWWGAILSAATNVLFMLLANMGNNVPMLYLVISADNLSAGLASAAFVAFLSSLTNISFTAVQYAIFTSLMTLLPKVLGGYSGSMVDALGYSHFFLMTALMGLPVLYLVWLAGKKLT